MVGFVDLVGFTALSQGLSPRTLARAVSEFEAVAGDLVTSGDGRVVKELGDGMMFVAADAGSACEIALGLLDALADHTVLPPLRASLAAGEVIAREGDYFGPVLASRVLGLAAPGELLVTLEARARVTGDRYRFEAIGRWSIRGLAEPVELFRVART
jgi:adenylate cyclase